MNELSHVAAPAGEVYFRYEVPANRGAKMLLLNTGGVAVVSNWTGQYGEQFIAWAPLPKRNKAEEIRLGLIPKARPTA